MPTSPNLRLVLVPAVLTLAVTVVRVAGELCGWSARWFSTAPGGGRGVGIVWLVPVFGAWFGWRLARAGLLPQHRGRALLLHAIAVAVYIVGFKGLAGLDTATAPGLVMQLLSMGAVSVVAAAFAWRAWPQLFATSLVYAVLARLPVAAITFVAVLGDWGTHFEKFGPNDYAGFAPIVRAAWLAYTQLVFWTSITVAGGGLCGTVVSLFARRAPPAAA